MNSFPFESSNIGTEAEPIWDRAITAENERNFNKLRYTNGVFAAPTNGLMVSAMTDMTVTINPGGCHLEGALAYEASQREVTLAAASNTLPRIDRVVCRFDTAEESRNVEIYLKQGVPATTPTAQDLIKQSNYYEIALADIYIPKQATEILNIHITDQRLNTELCGLVVPAIPYLNQTEELWKQISESIELVNSALSETLAGNLQAEIDGLQTDLSNVQTNLANYQNITDNRVTEIEDTLTNNVITIVARNPSWPARDSGWLWTKYSDGKIDVDFFASPYAFGGTTGATGITGFYTVQKTIPLPVAPVGDIFMGYANGYISTGAGWAYRYPVISGTGVHVNLFVNTNSTTLSRFQLTGSYFWK